MSNDVDAVIAALRAVLRDVHHQGHKPHWEVRVVNRWIAQLPGSWTGRWLPLRLRGGYGNKVHRGDLILHLNSTIAYLETTRSTIKAKRPWFWPLRASKVEPVDAEFKEVASSFEQPPKSPSKGVRLIRR